MTFIYRKETKSFSFDIINEISVSVKRKWHNPINKINSNIINTSIIVLIMAFVVILNGVRK